MTYQTYFKSQAKKLFKDYETRESYIDPIINCQMYQYHPKYFDIDGVIDAYDIDEENFSLMKAQHIIAQMVGFRKWDELNQATEKVLELAQLLFENQHKINIEDWKMYVDNICRENNCTLEADEQISILKKVFLEVDDIYSGFPSFLLKHKQIG